MTYDVAVIGAGIIGLAAARELLKRQPGLKIAILDKEAEIGRHQTGHNSGVLHAGIYYTPGSLKAKLCVQGQDEMYRYVEEHGIPFERCGKVIVAVDDSEIARLRILHERGLQNGVKDLELVGPERLKELEPHCAGVMALWSPNTGITDYAQVAVSYARELAAQGVDILPRHGVMEIDERHDGVTLQTQSGEIQAKHVLACAGLYADRVAKLSGAPADPRIVPFRGDYWLLRPDRRHLSRNLIYPVPDPSFPFLGVHFTRRINDGSIWLGPNAVLAFSREGYGRLDIRPADVIEAVAFEGFQKIAMKYWRTGLDEMVRDFSKKAFLESLQRYIPELTMEDLLPGPSGVRAQALDAEGTLVDDFTVNVVGKVLHVRNAPSPAATSSLAIARLIADRAQESFPLAA